MKSRNSKRVIAVLLVPATSFLAIQAHRAYADAPNTTITYTCTTIQLSPANQNQSGNGARYYPLISPQIAYAQEGNGEGTRTTNTLVQLCITHQSAGGTGGVGGSTSGGSCCDAQGNPVDGGGYGVGGAPGAYGYGSTSTNEPDP